MKPVDENERIGTHIQGLRAAVELLESGRDILPAPDFERKDLKADRLGQGSDRVHLLHGLRESDIGHNTQPAQCRNDFAQQFEPLAHRIGKQSCKAGHVAARSRQARDHAGGNRVIR